MLELICTRESGSVFDSGGLNCVLTFIREHGSQVHKDTLHSAMSVVSRLCGKMEPTQDTALEGCVESLSTLLKHEDPFVSICCFCFALFDNLCKYHSREIFVCIWFKLNVYCKMHLFYITMGN